MPVPVDDLLRGLVDGVGDGGLQQAEALVGPGSALLDHGQGPDHGWEVAGGRAGDGEVVHGPQGLHAEEGVLGHVHGADEVRLAPGAAAGIGLLAPGPGGARVEQPLVEHRGDLAEHGDGGGAVLRQAGQDGIAVQVQQHGGGEGGARGGVAAHGQEGLLAGHVAGAQDDHGLGAVPVVPGDLHPALGNDDGPRARLTLPEEAAACGHLAPAGGAGDQVQICVGQAREDLAAA